MKNSALHISQFEGAYVAGTPWYNNQPSGVVYVGKIAYGFKGEIMPEGTNIVLLDGTKGIAEYAFTQKNLVSITIPASVSYIDDRAFRNGNLTNESLIIYGYHGSHAEQYANSKNITFIAIDPHTITYNANGGTGAPAAQTKTQGAPLTLSGTIPTRSGYIFKGWATNATATTAQYQPGGSYTADANATLYAVWEQESVTPLPANKTALANRINAVKDTPKGNYTDASWSVFQTALSNAQNVANNPSATQAQVDNALAALNAAYAGLAENPPPHPPTDPPATPKKYIFSTKYEATPLNWILFFVCFGFIWMWF
ncbi:MAG: InlB B-repeat-containing protein [Oscillospiraceae bacterium]|nr:InlB B-repeat-containing protein [Oscillospiraceae bacterium]